MPVTWFTIFFGQEKPYKYHWHLNMYVTQNLKSFAQEVLRYTCSGANAHIVIIVMFFLSNDDRRPLHSKIAIDTFEDQLWESIPFI